MSQAAVLVLGPPRSGTSATAGILHRLGFFMGQRLLPAAPMNPLGFYQDEDFDLLFRDLPEWVPAYPFEMPRSIREGVRRLVAERCKAGEPWGAKFRLASWVIDDVADECLSAGFDLNVVLTDRPESESIASLGHYSDSPHDPDPTTVVRRCRLAATSVALARPTHTVSFRDLLADPAAVVASLASFLGVPSTRAAVEHVNRSLPKFLCTSP